MSSPGKSTSSNSSRPSRHVSTARAFHDYSRTQRGLPPVASRPVGVGDLLVKTYRFIREDGEERSLVENKSEDISASRKDDPVASTSATSRMSTEEYEQSLAVNYYNQLHKEYAIADLSRYKEGQVGLRWRTFEEVKAGFGQTTCGNTFCTTPARYVPPTISGSTNKQGPISGSGGSDSTILGTSMNSMESGSVHSSGSDGGDASSGGVLGSAMNPLETEQERLLREKREYYIKHGYDISEELCSFELPFQYNEPIDGDDERHDTDKPGGMSPSRGSTSSHGNVKWVTKMALVKVRLCRQCAYYLNYKKIQELSTLEKTRGTGGDINVKREEWGDDRDEERRDGVLKRASKRSRSGSRNNIPKGLNRHNYINTGSSSCRSSSDSSSSSSDSESESTTDNGSDNDKRRRGKARYRGRSRSRDSRRGRGKDDDNGYSTSRSRSRRSRSSGRSRSRSRGRRRRKDRRRSNERNRSRGRSGEREGRRNNEMRTSTRSRSRSERGLILETDKRAMDDVRLSMGRGTERDRERLRDEERLKEYGREGTHYHREASRASDRSDARRNDGSDDDDIVVVAVHTRSKES